MPRTDKSQLLSLAYEAYRSALANGQPPDPEEFCRQYPEYRVSLLRLIEAHHYISDLWIDPGANSETRWPQPGEDFAGFHLVRELGYGAFARVFLAHERELGQRQVVIKLSLGRTTEAATLGRLSHPHIVPIHSVTREDLTGLTALCMPFLGDATLCDVLDVAFAKERFPKRASLILEVARMGGVSTDVASPISPILQRGNYIEGMIFLLAQLADALDFAHLRGVCHGDLKPSNILLTPSGVPMLLDFNLSADTSQRGNRTGGTLPYLAPEQLEALNDPARAIPCSPRTDLYAFGVLVYELLVGHHPFGVLPPGRPFPDTVAELSHRQKHEPPSLDKVDPRIPAPVARLVAQCLKGNPEERPGSAATLAQTFRASGTPFQLLYYRVKRRLWLTLGALGCVVLATMMGGRWVVQTQHFRQATTGLNLYGAGRFEEALPHLEHVADSLWTAEGEQHLRLRPGAWHAVLAYCYGRTRYHENAIDAGKIALERGFCNAAVYNNLAVSSCESFDAYDDAREWFARALDLDPNCAMIHANRGRLSLTRHIRTKIRGQDPDTRWLESGESDLKRALALEPTPDWFIDLACVHTLQSQWPEALKQLRLAVQTGYPWEKIQRDGRFEPLSTQRGFLELAELSDPQKLWREKTRFIDPLRGQ